MDKKNRGKSWEKQVEKCWLETMGGFILRLPDQMSGYHMSSNISDYIAFNSPKLYLVECKSLHKNTLNFANLRQYEKMIPYKDIDEVYAGFIVWWIDLDKVGWIPHNTVTQLMNEGKKSIHVDILEDSNYYTVTIPAIKKRVNMECDFSCLKQIHK